MRTIFAIIVIVFLIPSVQGYGYALPFQTTDGETHNLDAYADQYILFEIMTTWCETCKEEIPELKTVYNVINETMDLISVGVDLKTDTLEKLEKYKLEYGLNWTIALDHEGMFQNTFNVANYPVIIFLGPEGNLLHKWTGYTPALDILEFIDDYADIEYDLEDIDQMNLYNSLLENSLFLPVMVLIIVLMIFYSVGFIRNKWMKST